ncbi:MAG: chorismate mutase [Halobacteriota archaeon]|nr:chorismate mutase [Halobacteriota archaeon]
MEADLKMPLDEVREKIKAVDEEIIGCIAERMRLAEQVLEIKKEENLEIEDKSQNERVLDRAFEMAREYDLDTSSVREIYKIILRMSIEYQKRLRG